MQSFHAIFLGLGAGFLMTVLLGAIFFLLLNQSIQNGYKSCIPIALGVITGDAIFVTLAVIFTSQITSFLSLYQNYISIIGGVVLIVLGVINMRKKLPINKVHEGKGSLYAKAFTINFLNPANAAWWLSLYSLAPMSEFQLPNKLTFGAFAIIGIFTTEIAVAFGAQNLKKWLNGPRLQKLNFGIGLVFILLGLKLVLTPLF